MSEFYQELMDFLDKLVKITASVMAGAMFLLIVMQVFTRHCPWVPTPPWTEELARYVMIYMAFIGASHGIKEWDNVNVDIILNRMPSGIRRNVEVIIKILVLLFLILVTVMSIRNFGTVGWRQKSPSLRIEMIYFQSAVIIGCFLCCLQCIGSILKDLFEGRKS